ncbi:hypothetical protein NE237_005468 [Protea cynaroides]|uniref:DYW domain-containing protein n=1 Tax=Protea cynaroides TaxID=273540 RepID=A0A9Q0KLD4_9MAGN|nr:hypothetical protein NE237_005468 [Protea cynaroides]
MRMHFPHKYRNEFLGRLIFSRHPTKMIHIGQPRTPHTQKFYLGISIESATYSALLQSSTRTGSLIRGKLIHAHMIKMFYNPCLYLENNLLHMYWKCGEMEIARHLFDRMPTQDMVSPYPLISGYSQIGFYHEAVGVFNEARIAPGDLILGKRIHGLITISSLANQVFLTNSLIDMCLFDHSDQLDDVSWNSLIAVLKILIKMHQSEFKLNSFALGSVIKACCSNVAGTALLDMYAKNGYLGDVVNIFRLIPGPNVVTFNAMIAGFFRSETEFCDEFADESLNLFSEIILKAFNVVGAFDYGKQIHAQIFKSNLQSDDFVESGLIDLYLLLGSTEDGLRCFNSTLKLDIFSWTSQIGVLCHENWNLGCTIVANSQICMYAKSGDIDAANLTFKETRNHDVVSWSAMISSNAQHGCAKEALSFYGRMKNSGITRNHVTFLGVLMACSHGGLVDDGFALIVSEFRQFEIMMRDHPSVKHCSCIVDLNGCAGRLADAESFIMNSHFKDDPVMWCALLGACRVHRDIVMGKHVTERIIENEPQASVSYVLLYNIYLDAGIKQPATEIRDLMKNRGVKMEPGLSWIEIGTVVNSFVSSDRSHEKCRVIYAKLEEIVKLAVTLGIIDLPKLAPIRVLKNLRVCQDCHTTMKFFFKVKKREIVLRDPIRFHRFIEGSCSCKVYW